MFVKSFKFKILNALKYYYFTKISYNYCTLFEQNCSYLKKKNNLGAISIKSAKAWA